MTFHTKALIAFFIFHIVVTGGGLIVGSLQTVTPTNDQDMVVEGVWRIVYPMITLTLSLGVLSVVYLTRGIWKMTRKKET